MAPSTTRWSVARATETAGKYLPLFSAASGALIVARLDQEACPVGWFVEGMWSESSEGYQDGVYMLAPSLDQFLATLVELDEVTWDTEEDELWEDVAE